MLTVRYFIRVKVHFNHSLEIDMAIGHVSFNCFATP